MTKAAWRGGNRTGGAYEVGCFDQDNTGPPAPQNIAVIPSSVSSRAVSFWAVHTFVQPVLTRVGSWPMVGSVEWQQLDDDDPRKIASLFSADKRPDILVHRVQTE